MKPLSNFIAGRPKAALLFWFFGGFKCGVCLFFVIVVRYLLGAVYLISIKLFLILISKLVPLTPETVKLISKYVYPFLIHRFHYINILKQELSGTKAYEQTSAEEKSVINHNIFSECHQVWCK